MAEDKLEVISKELKACLSKYDTQCALGHLSFMMTCITNGAAEDELGRLASPMRQLYYLAGLLMAQESDGTNEIQFSEEDWQHIGEPEGTGQWHKNNPSENCLFINSVA